MLIPTLKKFGVGILNPLDKSILTQHHNSELVIDNRLKAIEEGNDAKYAELMKDVVRADLAMLDKSDFLVVYVDKEVHMCGTYYEIAIATQQRKPILVVCKQGRYNVSPWIWGVVPKEMIFGSFDEMEKYLKNIDDSQTKLKRWRFFDVSKYYGN